MATDITQAGLLTDSIQVTPVHKMWHTDSQFENIPGDYAVLRMVELPRTGGDTVWASGYDVYDRLSPPMRAFLSTLTFTAGQKDKYEAIAAANGLAWYTDPRGAPENVGKEVTATHPVIRTNPVSGVSVDPLLCMRTLRSLEIHAPLPWSHFGTDGWIVEHRLLPRPPRPAHQRPVAGRVAQDCGLAAGGGRAQPRHPC